VVSPLQRYWAWNGLDTSFKEQTSLMGDIHHYAWRARGLNETVYLDPADLRKFGNWTVGECWTEECVEAHTNVDVIVDLQAVRALLDSRLPLVFQGKSVKEASLPWPPSGDDNGDDGEEEEEEEERKVPFGKEGQPVTAAPAKQEAKAAA
jgi:protein O-GlcNAc transferase